MSTGIHTRRDFFFVKAGTFNNWGWQRWQVGKKLLKIQMHYLIFQI